MQISEKFIYLNDEIHRATQKTVKYPNTFWQMLHCSSFSVCTRRSCFVHVHLAWNDLLLADKNK